MEQVPQHCGIVIFGASGDLAHRKLLPSLLQLAIDQVLPGACYIVGIGRTAMSDSQFQATVKDSLKKNSNGNGATPPSAIDDFVKRCTYLTGDYTNSAFYAQMKQKLAALDQAHQISDRRIFYLSTPPSLYETIAQQSVAGADDAPER